MKLFDQIWIRFVKVFGFLLGSYIMYHESIYDHSDRPYLYAAALAMMGTQIGEAFGKAMDLIEEVLSARKTRAFDDDDSEKVIDK